MSELVTTPPPPPTPLKEPPTLSTLGHDILFLIFSQLRFHDLEHGPPSQNPPNPAYQTNDILKYQRLYYISHKTLPVVRLICKEFNKIVGPLRYRSFVIKEKYLESEIAKRVIEDVKRWCRIAILGGPANQDTWDVLEKNYKGLPNLERILWRCYHSSDQTPLPPIPKTILRPNILLNVNLSGTYYDHLLSLPPAQISTLALGVWNTGELGNLPAHNSHYGPLIRTFLTKARNLRSLSYEYSKDPTYTGATPEPIIQFGTFSPGERMPPFKSLTLTCYEWKYSPSEFQAHWDFSRLEELDLRGINIYNFFSTVPPTDLKTIKILRLGEFPWSDMTESTREEGKIIMYSAIERMKKLEELYLTSWTEDFDVEILAGMENLRVLELWETNVEKGVTDPGLDLKEGRIERLQVLCPRLRTLVINLEFSKEEFSDVLRTFTEFESLTRITIKTSLTKWPPKPIILHTNNTQVATRQKPFKHRINATYTLFTLHSHPLPSPPRVLDLLDETGTDHKIKMDTSSLPTPVPTTALVDNESEKEEEKEEEMVVKPKNPIPGAGIQRVNRNEETIFLAIQVGEFKKGGVNSQESDNWRWEVERKFCFPAWWRESGP